MPDISSFGTRVRVVASKTFPSGFDLSQFADDTDPFDIPSQQIADKAMGLNGDLVTWTKLTATEVSLAVMANTEDADNLAALFEANRASRGKTSARDAITVTVAYPEGNTVTFTAGRLTDGPAATSAASSGRLKTNTYKFVFESVSSSKASS